MSTDVNGYSLSIFTLEADRKPTLVIAAKTHAQAEAFCADRRVRTALQAASLCDDFSILRVRLARSEEKALYRGQTEAQSIAGLPAVYLSR